MKKHAIYKAIFGNYDNIDGIDPEFICQDTDYYLITDEDLLLPSPWKLIKVERKFASNATENRYYKMNGHPDFLNYKFSVYLDGNVNIKSDVTSLLGGLDKSFDLHAYRHPKRNTISDELKACVIYNKISISQYIESKKEKYAKFKNTSQDMYECNILIKNNSSKNLHTAMSDWFNLFCNNIHRDQLYFPYILEKNNIVINSLGVSDIRDNSNFFTIKAHTNKAPWLDRKKVLLYRKINKFVKWL